MRDWFHQAEMPFGRLAARVLWAVRRAERPGRSYRVEAVHRSPAAGSILITDAADPASFVYSVIERGRLPPGIRAELDAFLAR